MVFKAICFFISFTFVFGISNAFGEGAAKVLKVLDGESLEIDYEGERVTLFLLGVEIPKLGERNGETKSKKYLQKLKEREEEAYNLAKTLVKKGDSIAIEFDVRKWDKQRRFVAYAFIRDGRMLNEEIIRWGYSNVALKAPNIKYEKRFFEVLKEAKENKRGMWK